MNTITINDTAESLGLTLEAAAIPEREKTFRVYKGAILVFSGKEFEVLRFLLNYGTARPRKATSRDAIGNSYKD